MACGFAEQCTYLGTVRLRLLVSSCSLGTRYLATRYRYRYRRYLYLAKSRAHGTIRVCWALCSFLIDDHSIASPNAKAQPATSFFDHKTTSVFHHGSNTVNYWHRDLRHNWRCPLCPNIWCARDGQAIEGQCRVSLVAKRNTYVGTQRDPRPPRVFSGALASASGRWTMLVNRRVCHLFARINSLVVTIRFGGSPILPHKIDLFVGTRHVCSCVLCSLQHNTHNITPLLVHPLLPLKQQDCQCCNHYCHFLHLALLVSFEERSLYTFDAHPRGSGRSTDKNCGGHFRTEAEGGWTVGVGENVQCGLPRGWLQYTLLHLGRPWGGVGMNTVSECVDKV